MKYDSQKVGVIGLGDMGSGLAKNLIKNGFDVIGFDLDKKRMQDFIVMGGEAADNAAACGNNTAAVFVMVMNGNQAKSVILGDGLVTTMSKNATVILTATIKPHEAEEIAKDLSDTDIAMIDTPVSGGFPGAQNGTLTMMASCTNDVLAQNKKILEAVSASIHHVGQNIGMGQTVKACLQSLIGSVFSATFEAAALAAKAGVKGQVLYDVFSTSSAGSGITNTALSNIIDRQFIGTGSHINTMHKDLTISLDVAESLNVPMHMAAAAMQLFHAGKAKYPEGDNWIVTRVIEDIIGAELHR